MIHSYAEWCTYCILTSISFSNVVLFFGTFVGLAADGGLKLQLSDGSQRIIRAGDVELVKEVGGHAARD